MGKGISASTVKGWFQYGCERKTRYELMDRSDLDAVPVLRDGREHAWAELGKDYEQRVVSALGRGQVVAPRPGAWSVSEAVATAFLAGRRPEQFAHQVDLKPSGRPAFLSRAPDVEARRTLADLIRMSRDGPSPVFTVIDVKAARTATGFHKAQVAYYHLLLRARLEEMGVEASLDDHGEIWRIPDDGTAAGADHQVERFALAPYVRIVETFCRDQLPRIAARRVEAGRDETFFHLYFKCEQCAYLDHCLGTVAAERATAARDVSAVPGLTHEGKRSLHRLGVRTVGQLAAARGLPATPDLGWSLQRRAPTLLLRAQALLDGRVRRTEERHSYLMPPRFDAAIYLAADHDPVDDLLTTLGVLVVREDGSERRMVEILDQAERAREADALAVVFGAVLEELGRVHEANDPDRPAGARGVHAHIFVYEPAEARSIQAAVKRHLDDARVRHGLLDMVRLFPPDTVVPEPEFRGMHHLPATALRSVVEQLFALPATVSYDLRQVSAALAAEGLVGGAYNPSRPFARPFSALLSLEVARGLREGRTDAPTREAVAADVAARLDAARAVAGWLRDEDTRQAATPDGHLLRLAKRPFRFQATFDPLQARDLDVLQAFELIESRAGLLERLVALAKPASRRREAGEALTGLDLLSHALRGGLAYLRLRVPRENADIDVGPDGFGLILTNGSTDVLLDPASWGEVGCNILPPREGGVDHGAITVRMARGTYLSSTFQAMLRASGSTPGAWCVDRSFADPNTRRIAAFLAHLAAPPTVAAARTPGGVP